MKSFIIISLFPIILLASMKNASDNSIQEENLKPTISTLKIRPNDYQNLAKIKMSEAIVIAQSKSAGKLVESSLESENNFLIYSITFSEPDKSISEIKIDAGSGNILDIENQSTTEL
ncbi:MAG: PepSY domain-containing protein [Pseudobdellovibrio sp.]